MFGNSVLFSVGDSVFFEILVESIADNRSGVVVYSAIILFTVGFYGVYVKLSVESTVLLTGHRVVFLYGIVVSPCKCNSQCILYEQVRKQ